MDGWLAGVGKTKKSNDLFEFFFVEILFFFQYKILLNHCIFLDYTLLGLEYNYLNNLSFIEWKIKFQKQKKFISIIKWTITINFINSY